MQGVCICDLKKKQRQYRVVKHSKGQLYEGRNWISQWMCWKVCIEDYGCVVWVMSEMRYGTRRCIVVTIDVDVLASSAVNRADSSPGRVKPKL
jgi:hypothetical protein